MIDDEELTKFTNKFLKKMTDNLKILVTIKLLQICMKCILF